MNCIEKGINREVAKKYRCSIPSFYSIKGLASCIRELSLNNYQNEYTANRDRLKYLTNQSYNECDKGLSQGVS